MEVLLACLLACGVLLAIALLERLSAEWGARDDEPLIRAR
jgi:hypothetical protein